MTRAQTAHRAFALVALEDAAPGLPLGDPRSSELSLSVVSEREPDLPLFEVDLDLDVFFIAEIADAEDAEVPEERFIPDFFTDFALSRLDFFIDEVGILFVKD